MPRIGTRLQGGETEAQKMSEKVCVVDQLEKSKAETQPRELGML